MSHAKSATIKQKVVSETKSLLIISAYLFVFFGALSIHKVLITGQNTFISLRLGYSLFEALLLAKVVLLGDILHLGERFRGRPLIVTTLAASLIFALFAEAFLVFEHVVTGFFHPAGVSGSLRDIAAEAPWIIIAHVVMLFAAFVPFFATRELSRILGPDVFMAMLFKKPASESNSRSV